MKQAVRTETETCAERNPVTMHTLTLVLRRENHSGVRGRLRVNYPLFFYPQAEDTMLICGDQLPRQQLNGRRKKEPFGQLLDNHTLTLCHRFLRAYETKCPVEDDGAALEAAMLYRVTLCRPDRVSLYCDIQSFRDGLLVDFYRFGETWDTASGLLLPPQATAPAALRDFKKQCRHKHLPVPAQEQYYQTGSGTVFFVCLQREQTRRRNRAPVWEMEYPADCADRDENA